MRWPRCNFMFFTEDESDPEMRSWHICTRAWGHWIQPMPNGRHMGPFMFKLPWDAGRPRRV